MLGSTGGYYLFVNLAGELLAYSMNTGMKILRVENPKQPKNDGMISVYTVYLYFIKVIYEVNKIKPFSSYLVIYINCHAICIYI